MADELKPLSLRETATLERAAQKIADLQMELQHLAAMTRQEQAHLEGTIALIRERYGVPDTWEVRLNPPCLAPPHQE